jgi:hypothetical protein
VNASCSYTSPFNLHSPTIAILWFTKFYPRQQNDYKRARRETPLQRHGTLRPSAPRELIDDEGTHSYDFSWEVWWESGLLMRASILRWFLGWALIPVLIVPQSLLGLEAAGLPAGAILHTQGEVWVNGYEARDSSAVFAGDLLVTKADSTAELTLGGSTVLIAPESVARLRDGLLELEHGSVSVGTSKGFKVGVNCIKVIPVLNEWTQYVVTDLSGSVQVAAHKDDVNVEHGVGRRKTSTRDESSQQASVHEGQQNNYDESELCGAPAGPTGASSSLSPKWIAAGAAGTGVLIWLLLRGSGSQSPMSASQP